MSRIYDHINQIMGNILHQINTTIIKEIKSFCSVLQREDYRTAEGALGLLDGGSLAIGAESFCLGWNLEAFLDWQGV